MASFTKKLYPSEDYLKRLTYRESEQLASLINGNIICIPLFFVFSVALIFMQFRQVGLPMIVSLVAFVASMILIKKNHIHTASYFSSVGFLIATLIVDFFAGFSDTGFVFFRGACFSVVMAILNYKISLKRGQLILFFIASLLMEIISAFTVYLQVTLRSPMVIAATLVTCLLGIVGANLILLSIEKQNRRILKHAENEHNEVEKNYEKITSVLNNTRQSLNIGKELNDSANLATNSVMQMNALYQNLLKCAENLALQTTNVRELSEQVNNQAGLMNESIQKQNNSLAETSHAINEISSNISNINSIAEKRREGMASAANILDQQNQLVIQLVKDIQQVKESSTEIAKFVQTVDSIAGQTALLAMNASIEAAHAGALGKGFSVIAQEIRKLSVETTRNANLISDTLKENTLLVQQTSDSVAAFAQTSNASTDEIKETVASMEDILHGIEEITRASSEVSESIKTVVDFSSQTENIVSEVVAQISEQDEGLVSMADTTDVLQQRVDTIKDSIAEINQAIDGIKSQARNNEEVSEKIAALLD